MNNSVPVVIYFHNQPAYECHINPDMSGSSGVRTLKGDAKVFFPWSTIQKIDFIKEKPVIGYNTPQPHVPI